MKSGPMKSIIFFALLGLVSTYPQDQSRGKQIQRDVNQRGKEIYDPNFF